MSLARRRKEFSLYIVDESVERLHRLRTSLQRYGFTDLKIFPTYDSALAMSNEELPHLVVLYLTDPIHRAVEFIEKVKELSDDVLSIAIHFPHQSMDALGLVAKNLVYETVVESSMPELSIGLACDRAVHRLYLQFKTEQLTERLKTGETSKGQPLALDSAPVLGTSNLSLVIGDVTQLVMRLSQTMDMDITVQNYLDTFSRVLDHRPGLFFRWVPNHSSFVVTQSAQIPIEKIKGVGLDLRREPVDQLEQYLANPNDIPKLQDLVQMVFRREHFAAIPHFRGRECIGFTLLFDHTSKKTNEVSGLVNEETGKLIVKIFELALERSLLLRDRHLTETIDHSSGALNRRAFQEAFDEEVARSRRIRLPVALLSLKVDHFEDIRGEVGHQRMDALMKSLSQLMRKAVRRNDRVGRMAETEFSILFPHTSLSTAAAKAERLRWLVEQTRFPMLESFIGRTLSISIGVSEYPSVAGDADACLASAVQAMNNVVEQGGNKVMMAAPPPGFRKDFEPLEVVR